MSEIPSVTEAADRYRLACERVDRAQERVAEATRAYEEADADHQAARFERNDAESVLLGVSRLQPTSEVGA